MNGWTFDGRDARTRLRRTPEQPADETIGMSTVQTETGSGYRVVESNRPSLNVEAVARRLSDDAR